MTLRRRFTLRLHRALVYHGLLKHPYGRRYARDHYTPTGGRRQPCPECPGTLQVADAVYADCTRCDYTAERREVGL